MIVIEDYEEKYKRTYSDEDYYIRKVGTDEIYAEAIDLKEATYEYEETDEKINNDENATEEDYINSLNKLGVYE